MLRILRKLPRSAWRQAPNAVSLALTFSLLVSSVPVGPFRPLPAQALIGDLTQQDYRWYDNADAAQPTAALATENTALTGQLPGALYQLRLNVSNAGNNIGAGAVFRLQFSTSQSGPWTDVGGASNTVDAWRGFATTPGDGVPLLNTFLSAPQGGPTAQTYEEVNPSAPTPASISKNKSGEWAWVVQPNATLDVTDYFFRMVRGNGSVLNTYTNFPKVGMGNNPPDVPTSLGPAQYVDSDWTNDDTPTLTFSLSDPDTPVQQVQYQIQIATASGFAALVVDFTADLQAQGATSYTVGQSGGTYGTGSVSMTLSEGITGYWWRVQAIDDQTDVSGYADAGVPGTFDFRVDLTVPTAGTVDDGAGADVAFNDGSLTAVTANWTGFSDALSLVATYEYSIGTSAGAIDIRGWTSVGASTSVAATGLVLHTGQTYFFNVRATDNAGNAMVTFASSDGQAVKPTLTVTTSTIDVQLGNFNPENNLTQIQTATITISTNAYNGFTVEMYATDFLRSTDNPAIIIPDFSGTYAVPAEWTGTGWGYNTGDCDVNGGAFWTGAGCTGNPRYARITQSSPGDIVGDHTALVTGATGPVIAEEFTITLRATTTAAQEFADYATSLVFIVVPSY